jgi:DNA polymerase-3 subunit epsilon
LHFLEKMNYGAYLQSELQNTFAAWDFDAHLCKSHYWNADLTPSQLPLGFDLPNSTPVTPTPGRRRALQKTKDVHDLPAMADKLARHPDYRVLRRLVPVTHFARSSAGPLLKMVILDTETTGLSHAKDRIIELAMLRVDVDTLTGLPVGDVQIYDGLEDPGQPIPEEVSQITGISDDMVRGQALDMARVDALLADVDLVVAHNAGFDRPFCEARCPGFAALPWACSFADIDWKKEGRGSAKLEHLALHEGLFYEAHRAEVDCNALLAVLMAPLPTDGKTGLARLLGAAASPSFRLLATQAPFDAKEALKARAYRWDAEKRVWHTRLTDETQLAAECVWLKTAVYGGRSVRVHLEKMDALVKYSSRAGALSEQQL